MCVVCDHLQEWERYEIVCCVRERVKGSGEISVRGRETRLRDKERSDLFCSASR